MADDVAEVGGAAGNEAEGCFGGVLVFVVGLGDESNGDESVE